VLYGQRTEVQQGPPLRLAAQVFGNQPDPKKYIRLLREAPFLVRAAIGGGRHARAIDVTLDGVDLTAFEPPLPTCDRVLNANAVFERAQRLFIMKERVTEIDVPGPCRAAHWTGPLPVKARGMPNVYTLHDVIPLQFPHFVVDRTGCSVGLHMAIARQADHIVTVSETSKQHIVDLLNVPEERISVTYQPVPPLPRIARQDAERLVETVYGAKPGAYALFIGAIEPKKNLKRLIEAFLLADVEIPLLFAGPLGWLYDDDVALIDVIARQTATPVRRLGHLPRRHAVALLQCARFLVFPSLYEGFGLPVLEAMQLGVPVLASNVGSLREVAGDAAVLVDPLDVEAMSRAIRCLGRDLDLRADLAKRGPNQALKFNKETYKERLADAYRKVGIELNSEQALPAGRLASPRDASPPERPAPMNPHTPPHTENEVAL
jgi:glycosyltransferase involved in cell wall biosynthesis